MAEAVQEHPHAAAAAHEPEDVHGDAGHHGYDDPNAAPMHHEIKEYFSGLEVFLAGFLCTVAVTAGIILGIVVAND